VIEPPPDDLMQWDKADLVKELTRVRAVIREGVRKAVSDDPRETDKQDRIIGGSPHGHGDALVDARETVLLDEVEVVLVDTKRGDEETPVMMLTLGGRINYSRDRVKHGYLFGADGAAGIVSELIALAHRAGLGNEDPHGKTFSDQFRLSFTDRMKEMP
jgi:hypothetical protein